VRGSPAGDFDYDRHGHGYAEHRRADPRIASYVHRALGDARTVLNVGAGAGSYEPADRRVLAVEPSPVMRAQRPPHLLPAVDATAERLPFDNRAFDAAMAMVTVHQWPDPAAGLAELRRVASGPVVVLTFDPDALNRLWLAEYAPELMAAESGRMPAISAICAALGGHCDVLPVPVPIDCSDGFAEAYYARPERFLDPTVRRAQSAWRFVSPAAQERAITTLRADLDCGKWDDMYRDLRTQPQFDGALRLVVGQPAS
jgi:SAM-dependent methyltransferase